VVGPEVLSGSTRLKAGTATKLVLNMLTTGAMVRLGKTFGNLMVDLRATNTKLRARTNRIVRILTGATREEAGQLLAECSGELKTALVARLTGLSPQESRSRLSAHGGQVREAVAGFAKPQAATRSDLILGIDGGGSHTKALLARLRGDGGWTVFGEGVAGPSNPHAVGIANATRALDEAVNAAFAAAGLERVPVAAACLGLAGAGRADEQAQIRGWAERVTLAEKVEVGGDVTLLLAAGTPDGWGVALVSGTGSCAFGRAPDGRTARAGGWGHLLGDEGSGYALVMAGLRAVVRAADGREPSTVLTERLPAAMNVAALNDLIPLVNQGQWDRAALAGLAPVMLDAAEAGDPVAGRLVDAAACALADTVVTVAGALSLEENPFPLALAGGVILGHESYRRSVLDALAFVGLRANPVAFVVEPAEGALRLCTRLQARSASDGTR
jgi:N-acetylglucosamine kinase-like BadF-type ATPase